MISGTRVYVKVAGYYKDKLRGLCGDFNGVSDKNVLGWETYGHSYHIGSCPSDAPPPTPEPCTVSVFFVVTNTG